MTMNENYNNRLIEYGKALLNENDKGLLKYLDKKFQIKRFQNKEVNTDLEFATDLKSLVFTKESFKMTFDTPIEALRDVFWDIKIQLDYLDYELPRYIYISLQIKEREWIWFEAQYPLWSIENKTLTFDYRIETGWDRSGYLLMGNLFNYKDFPFISNIDAHVLIDDFELKEDHVEINDVNRLLFKDPITLDLTKEKLNPYKVSLGFYF